ncbi:hypothetical protein BU196_00295 [Streptomyces sp. CBMA370]|nr:recombinase family protein [Streptomyces sp. CBMA370]MBD0712545.1 hypothetical protein [Streptomyces sp. CBMA370]
MAKSAPSDRTPKSVDVSDLLPGWDTPHRFIYPPVGPPPANWPRAIIYGRQSKLNEDGSNASPQMQKTSGEGLCQAKSYNPVACFMDAGKSGWDPNTERTGFDEMMTWVRAGKCDVVVIFALSRLTRQGALDALAIEAEMKKHGVTLVSVTEPYLDTSSAIGVGIFAIIAGLAKQESDTKSEFILNTRELSRQAGGHLAGPPPYGLKGEKAKTEDGVGFVRLVPELEGVENGWESAAVLTMVNMALAGKTTGQICAYLNAEGIPAPSMRAVHKGRRYKNLKSDIRSVQPHWSITQIHRVLRDPRIAGMSADKTGSYTFTIRLGEDGNPMHVHEGIITPAKWYLLQEALSPSGKKAKETVRGHQSLLAGWEMTRCQCEANMTQSGWSGGIKPKYRCSRSAEARRLMGEGHTANSIRQDLVDALVAGRVFARMLTLDMENENDFALARETARRFARQTDTSDMARQIQEYRAQLAHTQASLKDLYEERNLYKGTDGKKAWRSAVETMLATQGMCQKALEELEAKQTAAIVLPIDDWYGTDNEDPLGEGSPWSTWGTVKRREFLALWLDEVIITQPPGAEHVPTEERVTLHWATPATDDDDDQNKTTATEEALEELVTA